MLLWLTSQSISRHTTANTLAHLKLASFACGWSACRLRHLAHFNLLSVEQLLQINICLHWQRNSNASCQTSNSCIIQNLQISLNAGFWNSAELRSIEQSALTCLSRSSNCTCTHTVKSRARLFTCKSSELPRNGYWWLPFNVYLQFLLLCSETDHFLSNTLDPDIHWSCWPEL
jgi:hypothetical protein